MFNKRRPPSNRSEDEAAEFEDFALQPEDDLEQDSESSQWPDDGTEMTDEDFDELSDSPVKKRSGLSMALPVAAAAVVGLVALGLVYVNFIAPAAAPVAISRPDSLSVTDNEITPLPAISSNPPGNEAVNETAVSQAEITVDPLENSEVATPEVLPEIESDTLAPSALTAVPAISAEPLETPVASSDTTASSSVPVPGSSAVIAAPEPRGELVNATAVATADLTVRLDAFEKRLDQVAAAADRSPAAQQSAFQALNQELDDVKAELSKTTKRLQVLESRPVAAASISAPVVKDTPAKPASAVEKVLKPVESDDQAAAISRAPANSSSSASTLVAPVKKTTVAAKISPTPAWQLRAAQPGEAWISSGQSKELRKVGVGETLAGVGKVREIRQVGGLWEIVGSTGTIRQ